MVISCVNTNYAMMCAFCSQQFIKPRHMRRRGNYSTCVSVLTFVCVCVWCVCVRVCVVCVVCYVCVCSVCVTSLHVTKDFIQLDG